MTSNENIFYYLKENSTFVTLCVVLLSFIIYVFNTLRSRARLPPGPIGLPIFGYNLFLGKHPHKDIAKLSEKYGNIFT